MTAKKRPSTAKKVNQNPPLTDELLRDTWLTYERLGYVYEAAAEALGINVKTVKSHVKAAQERLKVARRSLGTAKGFRPAKLKLPSHGSVRRIIFTCIQNNTLKNEKVWASLKHMAEYYDAEIWVSTFTYAPQDGGSVKRHQDKKKFGYKVADRWYDIEDEYINDNLVQIAPGLVWCGHSNRLPTASDPLASTDSMNGRNSGVWPHTTIQMRPVATMHGDATKFNFTTGTIGQKNYMNKFAGHRAEFHHAFGGLLVEITHDGAWFPRQLNADSEGTIYDLDVYSTPDGVFVNEEGLEALVLGDIHRAKLDEVISEATFGEGRMVDRLKPKRAIYHDLLDFESRRHHSRKDPHERFRVYVQGCDSVIGEVRQAGEYLKETSRPWMEQIVIRSNHDADLDRWLKDTDWRDDMPNAEFYLDLNRAVLAHIRAGKYLNVFEWAVNYTVTGVKAKFNPLDNSIVVCKKYGGGIELGLHGDQGANGARGTPDGLAKIGRKIVIGDKHAPGIWDGCYVAGVTGKLEQGYNTGPSGWAAAHVPVYPNGKRQVILFWKGAYCADDYLENVL